MYWYIEFKLRYFENLKLFSISMIIVKGLFEPIVLRKKQKNKQTTGFFSITPLNLTIRLLIALTYLD